MTIVRTLAAVAVAVIMGVGAYTPMPAQELETLTGESELPLQVTGFAVGSYAFDGRTRDHSFVASKIAVSLFRELNDDLWFFGQLTTALHTGEEGGDVVAETEIDNLLINLTVPGASNLSLGFGKLDVPVGFERDDEPLNLQPSTSFNFELARPAKTVGLVGRWAVRPRLDLTGVVSNGWESQIDPNHGKTGLLRLGMLLSDNSSVGLSGMFGDEGPADSTTERYLVTGVLYRVLYEKRSGAT